MNKKTPIPLFCILKRYKTRDPYNKLIFLLFAGFIYSYSLVAQSY